MTIDPGECPRLSRIFRGCRFEPRYDELALPEGIAATVAQAVAYGPMTAGEAQALKPSHYVRDICIRCGRTVERG